MLTGAMHPDVIPVAQSCAINRATFNAICRDLSEDELTRTIPASHWRVRDYIAHLASIDSWVGTWFSAWADGREFTFRNADGTPVDIDAWNESRIIERKSAALEILLEEAANHRTRIERTMARFDAELLARPFSFRGAKITFLRYLQLWVAHDPAHTADMLKALPERATDPAITAWLAQHRIAAAAVGDINAKLNEPRPFQ